MNNDAKFFNDFYNVHYNIFMESMHTVYIMLTKTLCKILNCYNAQSVIQAGA